MEKHLVDRAAFLRIYGWAFKENQNILKLSRRNIFTPWVKDIRILYGVHIAEKIIGCPGSNQSLLLRAVSDMLPP